MAIWVGNKEYTLKSIASKAGKPPATMKSRLAALRGRGEPLEKIFDEDYWAARRKVARVHKKPSVCKYKIGGELFTIQELADITGRSYSTYWSRINRYKAGPDGDYSAIVDDSKWKRGMKRGDRKNKRKNNRKKKKNIPASPGRYCPGGDSVEKIPGPSAVEIRMEKMGLLRM